MQICTGMNVNSKRIMGICELTKAGGGSKGVAAARGRRKPGGAPNAHVALREDNAHGGRAQNCTAARA